MRNEQDELRRIFSHLKQFGNLELLAAGMDTSDRYNQHVLRLRDLGYDIDEFLVTEEDYKRSGPPKNDIATRNGKPILKYGVLANKHGAIMEYFHLTEDAIIVHTKLDLQT